MKNTEILKKELKNGSYNDRLAYLYVCGRDEAQKYADRYLEVIDGYEKNFGKAEETALFSAPGRTEIGGNHTDHQHGCVLTGSVNTDVIAAASLNGTNEIRILSRGYKMDVISLDDLEIHPEQFDKAISLIRGIARKFRDLGYKLSGFNAYTISDVPKGSGMSSSAAFEVLVGTIMNGLFANSEIDPVRIAQFGQYAENVYYDKPSGLMDQMGSAVGSVVFIDFKDNDNPVVEKVDFDLASKGHVLCIIDSGADHADLTSEYAAVPAEMKAVARFMGKEFLRDVDEEEFYKRIPEIRSALNNDRAVLRAIHFFKDNRSAAELVRFLKNDDFDGFLSQIKESGRSSFMYLQNVYAASQPHNQAVAVTLALCEKLLNGRGAYRVHGGGFAGTVQAFVPSDMLNDFKSGIEAVLGEGKCMVLSIRPVGGCELK